jgi:hypothetical protein
MSCSATEDITKVALDRDGSRSPRNQNPISLLIVIDRAAVALGPEHIGRVAPPNGGHDVIDTLFVGRRAGLGPQALALRASVPIRAGNLGLGLGRELRLLLSARA